MEATNRRRRDHREKLTLQAGQYKSRPSALTKVKGNKDHMLYSQMGR